MGSDYFVVLIETASNQRTIFQTNRLRENVGASELIHRTGTRFVLDAVGKPDAAVIAADPGCLESFLLDTGRNAPFEDCASGEDSVPEVILATSGKALLLTRTRERAEAIVAAVTWCAIVAAPGVVVRGAVEAVAWADDKAAAGRLSEAIAKVHRGLEVLRSALASPDLRFPRLPFVEECRSSGLPARRVFAEDRNFLDAVSSVVACKRAAGWGAAKGEPPEDSVWARMAASLSGVVFERRIDRLDGWMAIVHADGNGLGQVFLDFQGYAKATSPRDYIDKLRRFSLAIDRCSRTAALAAIKATWPEEKDDRNRRMPRPIVPVVLGGDDLTVICDGTRAVRFAAAYLSAFETESERRQLAPLDGIIGEILSGKGAKVGRMSAAAGIAIVKPHFPFHRAYEIAEGLINSAKASKKIVTDAGDNPFPCSCLDFQVVLDSSGSDLEPMRERMMVAGRTTLFARPYVVTPPCKLAAAASGRDWAERRNYGEVDEAEEKSSFDNLPTLRRAVRALARKPTEHGGKVAAGQGHLPRSQAHVLRTALDRGPAAAAAELELIRHRYEDFDWDAFVTGESLFFPEKDDKGEEWQRTRLLDAMELADLEAEKVAQIVTDDAEEGDE